MVDLPKLRKSFAEIYAVEPRLFSAPGRVNLIGEHTDYNEGFVLPMAADLRTFVAIGKRSDGQVWVHSADFNETRSFSLIQNGSSQNATKGWATYIQGVTETLCEKGLNFQGANLVIASDVPIGAGLSSSAALEIAVGFALAEMAGLKISRLELAQSAQRAEHVFVGTHSGLMDQLTATCAQANHAMLIDCRSFQITQIPMSLPRTATVICDTRVKHALVSSAYNDRRRECEHAVALLKQKHKPDVRALRDLDADDLNLIEELPEPERRRARHVVTENKRTLQAAQALAAGDVQELGELMVGSHESLRNDFEVSCPELDIMVDLALSLEGVSGARMMGGGFGGCTINLVDLEKLDLFADRMTAGYQLATGLVPLINVVQPDDGVKELYI
jgi:galactokinase